MDRALKRILSDFGMTFDEFWDARKTDPEARSVIEQRYNSDGSTGETLAGVTFPDGNKSAPLARQRIRGYVEKICRTRISNATLWAYASPGANFAVIETSRREEVGEGVLEFCLIRGEYDG